MVCCQTQVLRPGLLHARPFGAEIESSSNVVFYPHDAINEEPYSAGLENRLPPLEESA